MENGLVKRLSKNEKFKVISVDKNCGFAVIEIEHLPERGVSEHLGNSKVYQRLIKREAFGQFPEVKRLIESFVNKHAKNILKAEYVISPPEKPLLLL